MNNPDALGVIWAIPYLKRKMNNNLSNIKAEELLPRREYQEMLLARMAAGDLYANETRLKIRKVDMALDKLRAACGAKTLYASFKKGG